MRVVHTNYLVVANSKEFFRYELIIILYSKLPSQNI